MELRDKSKTFMLKHFTWQQFLIAATILTAVWYVAVTLIFYKHRIQGLLSGKHGPADAPEPLRRAWDEEFEEVPAEVEDGLVGKPTLPEGTSKVSMGMFSFAPDVKEDKAEQGPNKSWETEDLENEQTDDDGRKRQQSVVPDVLEELKSIFHILETEQGTKEDFISLFHLVSSKYPNIKGTSNQQALNEHIRENLPFNITDEELNILWP